MSTLLQPPAEVATPSETPGRAWDAAIGRTATAVTVAALVGAAGLRAPQIVTPALAVAVLGVGAVALAALGGQLATASRYAQTVLTALAAGCPVPFAAAILRGGAPLVDALQAGLLLAWVVLWIAVGLGGAEPGVMFGARVGAGLAILHLLAARALPDVAAHALAALAAVVVCGLLPWRALADAGVVGPPGRASASDGTVAAPLSLRGAFHGLTWAVVAVALTTAIAVSGLIHEARTLHLVLALAVLVAIGCRAVVFTDVRQVIALWAAVVVPVLVLLVAGPLTDRPVLVTALAVLGVVVVVVAGGSWPAEPARRRRVRIVGDVVERAVVPLVWVLTLVVVLAAVIGGTA